MNSGKAGFFAKHLQAQVGGGGINGGAVGGGGGDGDAGGDGGDGEGGGDGGDENKVFIKAFLSYQARSTPLSTTPRFWPCPCGLWCTSVAVLVRLPKADE